MDKDLTPLGELLEGVRQAKRPKLSQNAVAKAAGTSSTTYRRIISGVSRFGGQDVPFDGSADTVAQIAHVLDISPEQLEAADRMDAAAELRELKRTPRRSPMDEAEAMMDENEEIAARLVERIRRLRRDQRRLVEDLVRMLEADSSAPPDHRSNAR